jgi:hypothetical protein
MVISIAFHRPVFVPNKEPVSPGASLLANAAIDALAKKKILARDVRKSEMRHVQLSKQRGLFDIGLSIPDAESEECHLISEALTAFRLKVAGVVPPFGFEIRM